MPTSKLDFQIQHSDDVHKLKILELEIQRLNSIIAVLETENLIYKTETEYLNKKLNQLKTGYQSALQVTAIWSDKNSTQKIRRKTKLTENIIKHIKKYRDEGRTQKQIAEMLGVSVGLVNKACKSSPEPQA